MKNRKIIIIPEGATKYMIKNNLSLQPRRKRDRRRMKIETDCKMQINKELVTDYGLEDNACILGFGVVQDVEEVDEDGEN